MSTKTVMVNYLAPMVSEKSHRLNDRVKMCSADRGTLGNSPTWGVSSALSNDSISIEDRTAIEPGHGIGLAFTGRISLEKGTQHPGCGQSFPGVTPLEPSNLEKFEIREGSKELTLGNTWGEAGAVLPRESTSFCEGQTTRGTQDGNPTARANNLRQLGSSF